jgi:hypothetical protein
MPTPSQWPFRISQMPRTLDARAAPHHILVTLVCLGPLGIERGGSRTMKCRLFMIQASLIVAASPVVLTVTVTPSAAATLVAVRILPSIEWRLTRRDHRGQENALVVTQLTGAGRAGSVASP